MKISNKLKLENTRKLARYFYKTIISSKYYFICLYTHITFEI